MYVTSVGEHVMGLLLVFSHFPKRDPVSFHGTKS
jgi:hypothetical protein